MKKRTSICLAGAIAAVICVTAICVIFSHNNVEKGKNSSLVKVARSTRSATGSVNDSTTGKRKSRRIEEVKVSEKARPDFELEADEEAKLTELQKKLFAEIVAACDAEDADRLITAVQKMQAGADWPAGVPDALKEAAIDALKWFGADCLPELIGFLGESSEEAVEAVAEAFEDAILDADKEAQVAEYLKLAATSLKDADALDSLFMHFSEIPPHLQVEVGSFILERGSPAAKVTIQDELKFAVRDGAPDEDAPPVTVSELVKWGELPENRPEVEN